MNKLLLIAFLLCSVLLFGQGAATPEEAWNKFDISPGAPAEPSEFWFELSKDSEGSKWVNKSDDSKTISFNENVGYLVSTTDMVFYTQNTFDLEVYSLTTTGYTDIAYLEPGHGYEEWYLIKVPSTKNIKITLDINLNGHTNEQKHGTTISWYTFTNMLPDILTSPDNSPSVVIDSKDYGYGYSADFSFNLSQLDSSYVLLRIGNNDFYGGPDLISSYRIYVSTNNNICDNALRAPITDGTYLDASDYIFSSTTDKSLLTDDFPNTSGISSIFYGADDVSSNTNTFKGTWFRGIELDSTILYAATCGSTINPQLLVFKGCPSGSEYIAGENINEDNLGEDALFNETWNRDICLMPSNNSNWPVIKFPNDGTEYFFFLFGDEDGPFDFMLFHDNDLNGGPVLPVEWLVFDGQSISSTNLLQWSTASEERNDYFILEKSVDGENYSELRKIPGAGNSIFEKNYSFIDEAPYYLSYYRISQVDYDGTLNYGPQIVVVNESIFFRCSILKQPIHDGLLKIEIDVAEEMEVDVAIYSLSGHQLLDAKYMLVENKNSLEINTSNLVDGVYILKINNRMHQFTKKIIIQSLK